MTEITTVRIRDLCCLACGRAFKAYDFDVESNTVRMTCTCGDRPLEVGVAHDNEEHCDEDPRD
jgi:hypothetical protein